MDLESHSIHPMELENPVIQILIFSADILANPHSLPLKKISDFKVPISLIFISYTNSINKKYFYEIF